MRCIISVQDFENMALECLITRIVPYHSEHKELQDFFAKHPVPLRDTQMFSSLLQSLNIQYCQTQTSHVIHVKLPFTGLALYFEQIAETLENSPLKSLLFGRNTTVCIHHNSLGIGQFTDAVVEVCKSMDKDALIIRDEA